MLLDANNTNQLGLSKETLKRENEYHVAYRFDHNLGKYRKCAGSWLVITQPGMSQKEKAVMPLLPTVVTPDGTIKAGCQSCDIGG